MLTYNLDASDDNSIQSLYDHGTIFNGQTEQYAEAQAYVQHKNILYIYNRDTSPYTQGINTLDLLTLDFTNNDIEIGTISSTNHPCLASISLEKDYLIVIGGSGPNDNTRLFDIQADSWIMNSWEPKLNTARRNHVCEVVDQQIYAIGGFTSTEISSIEVLDISEGIDNIALYSWTYMSESLPSPLTNHRSVVYNTDIIVLGSYGGGNWDDNIYVINTMTNTVSTAGQTNYASIQSATVFVYPYIYSFGGKIGPSATTVASYQYHKMELSITICIALIQQN